GQRSRHSPGSQDRRHAHLSSASHGPGAGGLVSAIIPRTAAQYNSMSCPRAGPVLNFVRSTLKNGSIFSPSGPTCASRTQKFSERSRVLSRELVMYMRFPSPVTCIMLGCTPGATVLVSFGFFRSLTSHCWISFEPKQLTYRKRSSGDW